MPGMRNVEGMMNAYNASAQSVSYPNLGSDACYILWMWTAQWQDVQVQDSMGNCQLMHM